MKEHRENGYITLVLIIIVGALTAAVVLTALSDGISSAQTGLSFSQTYQARGYANACIEEALYRIHNLDITATENNNGAPTSFGSNEKCTYDASVSGANVTIYATGTSNRATVGEILTGAVSGGDVTIIRWN